MMEGLLSRLPFPRQGRPGRPPLRLDRELTLLINRRVAEEFALHAQEDYPRDVDILKVRRSLAVKRADGTVCLWGQRKRDVLMLCPIS